jgi:NADPH2:quinone reductase
MKAIQITQTGGPEVMSLREVPTPVPGPGEVLIRVAASGVNFIDLYVREGRYANPVPFIPGQEASGTIAAVGGGVRSVKEGDRVAWCSILGTYAEFALSPADRVVPIPADISFEQAAAVMLQGMTAHYLSHSAYPIRKADEILVHAGAGGVGLLLTQMAKALGARVTATVSTREKASLSLEAGADEVLQYTEVDFAERINAAGRRMNAVYDSAGKTTFLKSLTCLEERGTIVLYGTAGGNVAPFDLEMLASGSFHVTRPILKHYTATRSDLVERATAVFALVSTGQLKLRIERSYSLEPVYDLWTRSAAVIKADICSFSSGTLILGNEAKKAVSKRYQSGAVRVGPSLAGERAQAHQAAHRGSV